MEISLLRKDDAAYPPTLSKYLSIHAPASITLSGNPEILQNRMLALFCSVKYPGRLIVKTYDLFQELRHTGLTVIGGFHSSMERECLTILLRGAQPIIICLARSMERMRIPSGYREPLTAGRLLLISPFIQRPRRPSVNTTIYRNRLVAALADRIFVAYAEPFGKTESLCREVVSWQKPLYTLESDYNANIIALGGKPLTSNAVCEMIGDT